MGFPLEKNDDPKTQRLSSTRENGHAADFFPCTKSESVSVTLAYDAAVALTRNAPRRLVAFVANQMMSIRGDARRFGVDSSGYWINRQPEGSFVGPDIHTSHYHQVSKAVADYWFHDYTPSAGAVVIDVGAGIGEDAVILSHKVKPGGRVYAIEAHPTIYACLKETVRQSGLTNVQCYLLAIAERDGVVSISDDAHHLANSIIGSSEGIEIEAQSLDNFIEREGIDHIDLLKMNIEGAELGAMLGLERHASKVRHLAISCHDFVADQGFGDIYRTKIAVEQRMIQLGFVVSRHSTAATPWQADVLFGRRA